MVEVEATLNDRPLTYVSPEFDDVEPLTPAHLLHGHRIMSLPHEEVGEEDLEDPTFGDSADINQQARLQAFLLGQFRSRWKHEYLTSLREHHRATGINSQIIKTGDIVLVHDDSPRITWKLAVIKELMKGKDGLVCAAKIRTAQGRTNRPIAKLIPLEVSSEVANSSSTNDDNCDTVPPPDSSNEDIVRDISRPRRQAAARGRDKVKMWVKELGGPPEDVTDYTVKNKMCIPH